MWGDHLNPSKHPVLYSKPTHARCNSHWFSCKRSLLDSTTSTNISFYDIVMKSHSPSSSQLFNLLSIVNRSSIFITVIYLSSTIFNWNYLSEGHLSIYQPYINHLFIFVYIIYLPYIYIMYPSLSSIYLESIYPSNHSSIQAYIIYLLFIFGSIIYLLSSYYISTI